jgi:5-methylcytosine-specific restriction endonuclease McrA
MPRPKPEWIGRKPTSMPSVATQLRVLLTQGGVCGCPDNCGIVIDFDRDEVDCDHTIPLQDGGENRESNLRILLRKHHKAKTKAENIARGVERRHKAKALTTTRTRKAVGGFQTNRNSKFKKRMDGTLVLRSTGEPV